MKKLTLLVSVLAIVSMNTGAQVNIKRDVKIADSTRQVVDQKSFQANQPVQPAQTIPQSTTGSKSKFYSVDPTAFTSSWGVYDVLRVQKEGVYLYSTTANAGTPAYLVAPVNLPHNATLLSMKAFFYDMSATQDIDAIFWQGGPNFGGPDSYNLGQVKSNYSGGSVMQAMRIAGRVDNENHSYYVTVHPVNNGPWPGNGDLKIKRITIEYVEP